MPSRWLEKAVCWQALLLAVLLAPAAPPSELSSVHVFNDSDNIKVTPQYRCAAKKRAPVQTPRASAVQSTHGAEQPPRRRQPPPPPPPPELEEQRFEAMFSQLLRWREQYYNCIVPRQAFDASDLGEWVHRLRRLRSRGKIPDALVSRLDGIGFSWRVDNISAKWYHNLHVARRYKALHGTAEIPPDHADPQDPDTVEAARWLSRQKQLYLQQKLTQLRVRLLKEALGVKLTRPYAPTRRNLHPVIRREDAAFRRDVDRRAAQRAQQQPQHGT